jgi:hypothetical protein
LLDHLCQRGRGIDLDRGGRAQQRLYLGEDLTFINLVRIG